MARTHFQRTAHAAAVLVAAALCGCATATNTSSADSDCTEHRMVPITAGDKVYFIEGGCKAWGFGPTMAQRAEFDKRWSSK